MKYEISFIIASMLSFLFCLTVIIVFKIFNKEDKSINAMQSAHRSPTPRLGGCALLFTFFLIGLWQEIIPIFLLIGLLPIFVIGLFEDLNREIKPNYRLAISSITSMFSVTFYSGVINHIDHLPTQMLLSFYPIALAFTTFAIVGMINAVNVIDGLNGFSGIQSIIMLSSIAYIANALGDSKIFLMSLLLIFSSLGFLLLNFPKGRIFMGDAGAYCIGFLIALFAIKLHNENTDFISSWAILLIVFWPVSDLLMSIYRRLADNRDTKKPDLLHFHHLVMRSIELITKSKINRELSNPLATIILGPISCAPACFAALNFDKPKLTFIAVLISTIVFIFSYFATARFMNKKHLENKL